MRVAIYIRVSSEEQVKEGYSISAQKQKLKAFCIAQDWEVVGLYPDEGISAKDTNRPQLQKMLKDIESGMIDCVLVWRLDRLTRSVLDLYSLLEIFEKYDCKFKSATEIFDTTTAIGRMFITIVAALAQWERENMGERISFGFAEKARQGKYPMNFRPFGYNLDLQESKLSIKEDEAAVVRTIYQLYIDGNGGSRICQYLNKKGIRTRDGNQWLEKPVMQILKNPLYIGSFRWRDLIIEDAHDPIVTKEMFETVQRLRAERRTIEPRRVSSSFIFSGKIKCPNCHSKLIGYHTSFTLASGERARYNQYRCRGKIIGKCKGTKNISERRLENAFLDYISSFDYSEHIDEIAAIGEKEINAKPENNNESLQKELEKIQKRKRKWQYAWVEEDITDEDFKELMSEANEQERLIRGQMNAPETDEEEKLFSKEEIAKFLSQIKTSWLLLEQQEKKNLVGSIIEEVHFSFARNKIVIDSVDFL